DEVGQLAAVAAEQVVAAVLGPAVGLGPAARLAARRREPDGAGERHPVGDRRRRAGLLAEREVDGVLRHHAVGGELAAGDDDQARGGGGGRVLARHLGRGGALL